MEAYKQIIVLFLLAVATSLDSLGVGVAYGLSGTRLRFSAHICISTVMLVITYASVAFGNTLARFMPPLATHLLSAVFFIGVGIWILFPLLQQKWQQWVPGRKSADGETPTLKAVLNNPELADMNGSRDIDVREALLLGMALSLNNIGGGISAGIIQLSPMGMALLSVLFNIICLVGGDQVGKRLSQSQLSQYAQSVSGLLMIIVGLWQLH